MAVVGSDVGLPKVVRHAKTVGSGLLVLAMFFAAWFIFVVGALSTFCVDSGAGCGDETGYYTGMVIAALIALATGPVAWRLSGKRNVFLATPILAVPLYAVFGPLI